MICKGLGKDVSKQKISWHCPFKIMLGFSLALPMADENRYSVAFNYNRIRNSRKQTIVLVSAYSMLPQY